mmetsp:Transcript_11198/g.21073  ORF Transcript_11198/g.21073 Transcript_11198/m.21073 type:complete len:282 (+) Transcript_11198:47-892(+)
MPLVMPAQRKPYTVEEVIKHNTPSSLWVIMNRKVYDVTAFHKKHPGGPGVLLQMGGKDATAAAAAAHKSILPANLMWEFCIGYIVRAKPPEEGAQLDVKRPVQKKATSPATVASPRSDVAKTKSEAKSEASVSSRNGISEAAGSESPTKSKQKNKRRSPPAFVADVERMLTRPVLASPTKSSQDVQNLQKQTSAGSVRAQADEEAKSPEASDPPEVKQERSFTTIMEEMDSDVLPMHDADAIAPEPPPHQAPGMFCFLSNTACWSQSRPSDAQVTGDWTLS